MARVTEYPHGQFCFAELSTPTAEQSSAFYADVFGWRARDGGLYLEDALVAGLRSDGPARTWLCRVAVADVDRTVARCRELGGEVERGAHDAEGGRFSLIRDPQGARLGLWQAGDRPGAQLINQPGAICWTEYATPDSAAAQAFYGPLFGWRFHETNITPRGYQNIINDGRVIGAILHMNEDWAPGSPAQWNPYVAVDDCRERSARVQALGGRLVEGPLDAGRASFAILADPQGAPLRLMERRRRAPRAHGA